MKPILISSAVFMLVFCVQARTCGAGDLQRNFFHGVNLPQAGFGQEVLPGIDGKNYKWQTAEDVNLYADMGSNILRVAFLWERMQPFLNGPLRRDELAQLDQIVAAAASRHVTILLDVHNYGAYKKSLIGSQEVPVAAFADLWKRLAEHYRDQPYVAFGLMNEPYRQDAATWAPIAQQAIDAIRRTGARQLILVPGTRYSGAHVWLEKDGALSNAEALGSLKDPANNFVFEVHQYFDRDTSGTHPDCVSEDIGEQRLSAFTAWLRQTGHKGFLGEFGASKDPVCLKALERTLKYMADNQDVWYGWTYWAAAAWFGDYMFNIYPPDSARYPQVDLLKKAMQGYE